MEVDNLSSFLSTRSQSFGNGANVSTKAGSSPWPTCVRFGTRCVRRYDRCRPVSCWSPRRFGCYLHRLGRRREEGNHFYWRLEFDCLYQRVPMLQILTATSTLCSSRDKDLWGQVSSVPSPVSVHYKLLQTLDNNLITNYRRPQFTVTSISVELSRPSYFELAVPNDPRRSSPPDAKVEVAVSQRPIQDITLKLRSECRGQFQTPTFFFL